MKTLNSKRNKKKRPGFLMNHFWGLVFFLHVIILIILIVLLCTVNNRSIKLEDCQIEEGFVIITSMKSEDPPGKAIGRNYYVSRFAVNGKDFFVSTLMPLSGLGKQQKESVEFVEENRIPVKVYYAHFGELLSGTKKALQMESITDGTVYWSLEQTNDIRNKDVRIVFICFIVIVSIVTVPWLLLWLFFLTDSIKSAKRDKTGKRRYQSRRI